jgi:uncharacterized protein (TIGR03382 family)
MSRFSRLFSRLCSVGVLLCSVPALAWQIEDPLHSNCHETMTQEALDRAGYVESPPQPSDEDRRLLNSTEFDLAQYDQNPWAWALILGVRYPDLEGAPSFDFDDLSRVHNAIAGQDAHCLRSEMQDGPEGDEEALAMYWQALSSLDEDGRVDASKQTVAKVNLIYSGKVDYPVSELYFAAGRALHAVQDSFTHTYRDPNDWRAVRTVFNWSDQVSCTIDEKRDGHGHESLLDDCEGSFESNDDRMSATQAASEQLLSALRRPGDRAERARRLEEFLDEWFTYQPGCTFSNDYCDHPVQEFLVKSPDSDIAICEGCSASSSPSAPWALLLGLGLLRARRAARGKKRGVWTATALVSALLLSTSVSAEDPVASAGTDAPADAPETKDAPPSDAPPSDAPPSDAPPPDAPPPDAPPPAAPPTDATAEPMPVDTAVSEPAKSSGYRTEVRTSMSVQNPALAIGVAPAWRFTRFDVGLFLELNPWFSVERGRISAGTTNVGAFFHYLHPLSEQADLRFGVGLGTSILNESLAGSPAGKFGPFLNLRLLGFVYHRQDVTLTVDGFDLAIAAPQMTGWPVVYAQHRLSVGLQF